jgi:hypothetical protein
MLRTEKNQHHAVSDLLVLNAPLPVAYQVDWLHCCMTNQGTCHLDFNFGIYIFIFSHTHTHTHTHKVHLYRTIEKSHTCPYTSHDCMTLTTSFTQSFEPHWMGCLDVRNFCENAAVTWGSSIYGGIVLHCRGEYTEKAKQKFAVLGHESHTPYPNTEYQKANMFRETC